MTQKIIVSKSGYNATTETDPDNLIFSSDYETLRYATSGTINLSWSIVAATFNAYSTSVAHGLAYIPFFVIFVDKTNSGTFQPAPYAAGSAGQTVSIFAYADGTNIYFKVQTYKDSGATENYTAVFRYFIFKNNVGL